MQQLSLGPHFVDFLAGFIARAAGCLLFLLGAAWFGRRAGARHGLTVSFGLGLLVTAYLAFAVLAVGWRVQLLLPVIWGSTCFLGVLECRTLMSRKTYWPPLEVDEKALLYVLGCGVLFGIIGSTTPEFSYDSLVYHLAAPKTYLDAGHLIDLPYNHYSYLPSITAMLYALALASGGVPMAKLLSLAIGGAMFVSIFSIVNRECGRRGALAAAAVCSTLPLLSFLSFMCNSDLSVSLFLVLALILCRTWHLERGDSSLYLGALFCGAALATKYTAALGVIALLGYVFLTFREHRPSRPITTALIIMILILLPLIPWWVRTAVHRGNPFYPYCLDWFSGGTFDRRLMANWYAETRNGTPGFALFPHLAKIWHDAVLGFEDVPFNYLGPAVLGTLPIALIVNGRKWIGSVCLTAWCVYLLGLTATHISRLLLPYVVIMAATGAAALVETAQYRKFCVTMLVVISAHNVYRIGQIMLLTSVEGLSVLTGRKTDPEYLSHHRNWYPNPSYSAFQHIRQQNPASDQKVLMIGDSRILHSPLQTIANAPHDMPVIFAWANESDNSETLFRRLRDENISFIVSNKLEGLRTDSPLYLTRNNLKMITEMLHRHFKKTYQDEWAEVYSVR